MALPGDMCDDAIVRNKVGYMRVIVSKYFTRAIWNSNK
jgi:hypothetical protein